jgi:NhaP-type Na+/H+ or K+/H+ antiporter
MSDPFNLDPAELFAWILIIGSLVGLFAILLKAWLRTRWLKKEGRLEQWKEQHFKGHGD